MKYNDRLEAINLIARLVDDDSSTFSSNDAKRLVQIIPLTPYQPFIYQTQESSSSEKTEGFAAGIGNISTSTEGVTSHTNEKVHRVGKFKITHRPGRLTIEDMWNDTRELEDERTCVLAYHPSTGDPKVLKMLNRNVYRFTLPQWLGGGIHSFGFQLYKPWKYPA